MSSSNKWKGKDLVGIDQHLYAIFPTIKHKYISTHMASTYYVPSVRAVIPATPESIPVESGTVEISLLPEGLYLRPESFWADQRLLYRNLRRGGGRGEGKLSP